MEVLKLVIKSVIPTARPIMECHGGWWNLLNIPSVTKGMGKWKIHVCFVNTVLQKRKQKKIIKRLLSSWKWAAWMAQQTFLVLGSIIIPTSGHFCTTLFKVWAGTENIFNWLSQYERNCRTNDDEINTLVIFTNLIVI